MTQLQTIPRRDAATFIDMCATLLEHGYRVRFAAEGTSMMPAVQSGDLLTVGPIDRGSIAPGDIVLFRQGGRPIAHRVEEIRSDESGGTVIIARGDGKAAVDAPIASDKVLGKVIAIEVGQRASDRRTASIASDAVIRFFKRFLSASAPRYSLPVCGLELAPERSRSQA